MRNTMIINGTITLARFGTTKFDSTEKNRIALKSDDIDYDILDDAYKTTGAKMTPSWLKDRTGYINLSSKFDIPVKTINGKQITFDEFIETPTAVGSEVKLKIAIKEGAIYPIAIVIVKDGEEIDPFDGM